MKYQLLTKLAMMFVVIAIVMLSVNSLMAVEQVETYDGEPDFEVLMRGPVHEAFAEPNVYNPTEGIRAPAEPPADIEEIPPEERPEGGDVIWIPGYWSWDSEFGDFIWVSGIWRIPPPGCSWVPGYWSPVGSDWIWTPGFWLTLETDEIEYLPPPPASLEIGPSSRAPAGDYLWAPGCWIWIGARYAWRPGYWVEARYDWVWSPAHYVWSPRGYIYVDGYWDWTIERRGVLFAPVYYRRPVYARHRYIYSPRIVIKISFLTTALFVFPGHHHYYFGDYYGDEYYRRGIHPWFDRDRRHRGYDPIFDHYRWQRRHINPHWDRDLRKTYDYRKKHHDARPPRIYSEEAAVIRRHPEGEQEEMVIAAPLNQISRQDDIQMRFNRIDEQQRQYLGEQGKELNSFRDERFNWEATGEKLGRVETWKEQPVQVRETREQPVQIRQETRDLNRGDEQIRNRVDSQRTTERPRVIQENIPRYEQREQEQQPIQIRQGTRDLNRSDEQIRNQPSIERQTERPQIIRENRPTYEQQSQEQQPIQIRQGTRDFNRSDEQIRNRVDTQRMTERPSSQSDLMKAERQRIPRSPVVGRQVYTPGQGSNPPGKPNIPIPDMNIRSTPGDRNSSIQQSPARSGNEGQSQSQNNRSDEGNRN